MRSTVLFFGAVFGVAGVASLLAFRALQLRPPIGEQADGSFLVSTGQRVTPVGLVLRTEGARPKKLVVSPDGSKFAVLAHNHVYVIDRDSIVLAEANFKAGPLGIAWSKDQKYLFLSGNDGRVAMWEIGDPGKPKYIGFPEAKRLPGQPANPQPTGIAVSRDGTRIFVALGIRNAVAVVDVAAWKVLQVVPVGNAPYHVAISPDGLTLAVANRGGSAVEPSRFSAPSAGTSIRVDRATDAAYRGTVSLINTTTYEQRELEVGRQPAGMCFSRDSKSLAIAESDSDSVRVLDVASGRTQKVLILKSDVDPEFGKIPTDVVYSTDGNRLYVTCGGINAVAVISLAGTANVVGYIPTGWYPISVGVSGGRLFIASSKGVGSRPDGKTTRFGVHDNVGTIQVIRTHSVELLARRSHRVAVNNGWSLTREPRDDAAPVPVPERVGEPSLFKHVVYIIKENLTYDSVFGDEPRGNGDPALCMYPEAVTPNLHALSREFMLFDNFYTSGTNSADGHQWVSSSIANGYTEQNYASNARSYPYDGGDPLAYSPKGFLWNAALAAGKRVRIYGEFVNRPRVFNPDTGRSATYRECWQDYVSGKNKIQITADTDQATLKPLLHPNFIGFPSTVSDQWRADQFLAEFRRFEAQSSMPDLIMMLLPNDHTVGTTSGFPTPRSMVADNDLAVGRIVEAISKSKFWKDTLIIIAQDDSQGGVDHVDGHRSVMLCVSPYTRRGVVDSNYYDHTSIARTIGLVLGFGPMNRFDRAGVPLSAAMSGSADATAYVLRPNQTKLDEMNKPPAQLRGAARRFAQMCADLDWSDVDRADADVVVRANWHFLKPNVPFPSKYWSDSDGDGD